MHSEWLSESALDLVLIVLLSIGWSSVVVRH
jgi:hypothetical protein